MLYFPGSQVAQQQQGEIRSRAQQAPEQDQVDREDHATIGTHKVAKRFTRGHVHGDTNAPVVDDATQLNSIIQGISMAAADRTAMPAYQQPVNTDGPGVGWQPCGIECAAPYQAAPIGQLAAAAQPHSDLHPVNVILRPLRDNNPHHGYQLTEIRSAAMPQHAGAMPSGSAPSPLHRWVTVQ